jgi:hypothetical protein
VTLLDSETKSQSETVYETIKINEIKGFIFVKDSDSFFNVKIDSIENQVVYHDLNNVDKINARSKSYIKIDSNKIITNIVEKNVISSHFSVGGYGFNSSELFCDYYDSLKDITGECYISNVIFEMILNNQIFIGKESQDFEDWGTLTEWRDYTDRFYTFFVDLDGTLITNTSAFIPPYYGEGEPIKENIELLRNLHEKNLCKIIITTSRPKKYEILTKNELEKHGIKYDEIIFGLFHSKRVLINDYSQTNTYPSALSINLKRDKDLIKDFIKINSK